MFVRYHKASADITEITFIPNVSNNYHVLTSEIVEVGIGVVNSPVDILDLYTFNVAYAQLVCSRAFYPSFQGAYILIG